MIPPKAGRAVIFLNYDVAKDGFVSPEQDWAALHAGCHVLKGEKYVANQWINAEAMEAHCSQHRMGQPHPHSDLGLPDWLRGRRGGSKRKRRQQRNRILRDRSNLRASDDGALGHAQHDNSTNTTEATNLNRNVQLASSQKPMATGSWRDLRAKLLHQFKHKDDE